MMAACAARFDPAVEAAMLATFGVDTLADPGPSPRRMHHLLQALPSGAFPGVDHPAAWSTEAHLLAAVVDEVRNLTWVEVAKASKRRPKQPKPMPRPGARRRQKVTALSLADALTGVEGVRTR